MRFGDRFPRPLGGAGLYSPFARCLPSIGGSGRVSRVSVFADLSDWAHAGDATTRHANNEVASFMKPSSPSRQCDHRAPRLNTIGRAINTVNKRFAPQVSEVTQTPGGRRHQ